MRKRDHIVKVRVSSDEKTLWETRATAQQMTLADLIRASMNIDTVDREPKKKRLTRQADPILLANIGRVGSNLNQLARWANTHKSAAEAAEIMLALVAIEKSLRHVSLKKKPGDRDAS